LIKNLKLKIENLKSGVIPTWCPGCHDYVMYAGIENALKSLAIPLEKIVIVYDIGCIGNMADFFKTYAIHSLHGRCLPTAIGVKLANPDLTVIAIGGDGGVYGEGLGHLLSWARSPVDINVFVANNNLYSLTTGQTSPTTPKGSKTKSTPLGTANLPIDPIPLVKSVNPDVHAVSVDGHNPLEVISAFKAAISHPGFSLVDCRQICVTFGKQLTI
jgi:2-oxoglutarate/2-oxoacid ferredoxin oxidoreductase subunit beta